MEKSASLEPFVPEEDEDFWGKAADEAEPVPMEFTTETPIVEAVVESAVPPFLPSGKKIFCLLIGFVDDGL